jgi:hypothetical protein
MIFDSLLHPLSPRGKLVYHGLEGLASANILIQAAQSLDPLCLLREHLYRVALDQEQCKTLQATAMTRLHLILWQDATTESTATTEENELEKLTKSEKGILGALKMHNGCKVVLVPTYLQSSWSACQSIGTGTKFGFKMPYTHWRMAGGRIVSQNLTVSCFRLALGMFQCSRMNLTA